MHKVAKNRKQALMKGTVFYAGKPCKTCGKRKRYTSTSGCQKCLYDRVYKERADFMKVRDASKAN